MSLNKRKEEGRKKRKKGSKKNSKSNENTMKMKITNHKVNDIVFLCSLFKKYK